MTLAKLRPKILHMYTYHMECHRNLSLITGIYHATTNEHFSYCFVKLAYMCEMLLALFDYAPYTGKIWWCFQHSLCNLVEASQCFM